MPGLDPGTVMVIGGGIVGSNAAVLATQLKAKIVLLHVIEKLPENYESRMMGFSAFISGMQFCYSTRKKLVTRSSA